MEPSKRPVLNSEQQNAVYCTENTVVAAGAGSGKTMVLASRYSWLVIEKKIRIKEILTLTFTKKAAAQMYQRIHQELTEKVLEETGEKAALAKQALEDFSHARIQTLDSYCATIAKQSANRYGISPDFAIDEEGCHRLALDESLSFLIANRNHPAMERLFMRQSPMNVAKNIFATTLFRYTYIDDSPSSTLKNIKVQFAVVCSEWRKQSDAIKKKLDELSGVYNGNEKFHPDLAPLLARYNEDLVVFPGEEDLRIFFEHIANLPHKLATDWAESQSLHKKMIELCSFLVSLKELNLTKGSPRNNPAKELLKQIRILLAEFSALIMFCLQAGLTYSVLMLLAELQLRFTEKKRTRLILTFSDVAQLAKTTLLEQHDIRQSEKAAFKSIMIDEFQDNNELQKDLLFFLAEKLDVSGDTVPSAEDLCPGKLFFVGDEKQSIYKFRGAEVSVFRKLKTELGNMELPLKTNYRSVPRLIGAFNTIFGGFEFDPEGKTPTLANLHPAVFAPDSTSLPSFEASYASLRANKTSGGKLTLCILDKQDTENDLSTDSPEENPELLSPAENEARYIAEKIKSLLEEKDDEGGQKYKPSDIAILFRSRTPQHHFEKHLMLLNIPYISEDLGSFFFGGPVNDIMSVLRLAAYPTDKAAYARMLRSPFAGLSLPGLTACLAAAEQAQDDGDAEQEEQKIPYPFDDNPIPLLSDSDKAKYLNGRLVYERIVEMARRQSISSLVSALWFGEGYRYETEWNPQVAAYREMYDYLFHLAVQADEDSAAGSMSLAAFTDYIQDLDNSGERLSDIEIPLERKGAVHLMTIHKSKGLEFPVVFLCCCDKKGRNDVSDDIFETEHHGLTLNPPFPAEFEGINGLKRNYFWERSLAAEKQKGTAELRRLLYVGMTRAEKELYISGCLGVSKRNENASENTDEHSNESQEDFSLLLKRYIEAQTQKAIEKGGDESRAIAGDSIIDDNTFFGLCLPAFGAHIPEGGIGAAASFFDIEKIPAYTEQHIRNAENQGSRFQNDQKGMGNFFQAVNPYYENVNIVKTPHVAKKHFSPTILSLQAAASAEPTMDFFVANAEYSGANAANIFEGVDKILTRYAKSESEDSEKFNQKNFGTIAHTCVEARLNGKKAILPPKLAGFLSDKEADALLEAGNELAEIFVRSPLGIAASASKNRKSEFPFRTLMHANDSDFFFISGIIDLLFEDVKTVHVVDFKTDMRENPAEHVPQMACYHKAATDVFAIPADKNCRVWLYYLRSGHAIEATKQAREYVFTNPVSTG